MNDKNKNIEDLESELKNLKKRKLQREISDLEKNLGIKPSSKNNISHNLNNNKKNTSQNNMFFIALGVLTVVAIYLTQVGPLNIIDLFDNEAIENISDSTTTIIQQDSTTSTIQQDSTTSTIQQDSTTTIIQQDSTTTIIQQSTDQEKSTDAQLTTEIESIYMSFSDSILFIKVNIYSEQEVFDIGTLAIGCLDIESAEDCISNTKKVQQIFDSHHPEADVGNGRFSACNDYHGLNVEESFKTLENNRYEYICKKYEFNHKNFIISQIDIDIKDDSLVRYNLSQVSAVGYGWQSDELSCFNNTKGWTAYADGVPQSYTPSLGYPADEDYNTNEESCTDITKDIIFNNSVIKDGGILFINN